MTAARNELPIVAAELAASSAGISRREIMNAMTAIAAISVCPPAEAAVQPLRASRVHWDSAVARLARIETEYKQVSAKHSAVFDAAEAACPRGDEFFSRYDLGCYNDLEKGREWNLRSAQMAIVAERAKEKPLTPEQAGQAAEDARSVVDRFDAYLKRRDEVHALYDCDQWEERFDDLVDKRWNAQKAVVSAHAPDHAAVLVKLELLAEMMDGEEDQGRVVEVREDVRRLLAA